ncbi:MAG: multidrug effflux MFS transporter [Proteobacteria bacterium]|nr:multidrug effflux MFS transporter [Pseudomonadota bacterium]
MSEKKHQKKGHHSVPLSASSETKPAIERKQYNILILVLGALSAIGPFSIDMYLPGFPAIAADLHTDIAHVGFSLTSYFIGISIGQIAYGPAMDRYGRKKPLIVGLIVYIAAALSCALAPSINFLITMRLFLALGGCVGMAGSRAVVRDLFSGSEVARVLSALVMVFGVSPIIAPTIGGLVVAALGWRFIFLILAAIAIFVLIAICRFLRESKGPDISISLHPKNVVLEYLNVFKEPAFITYTCASSVAIGGFFSYISGSPFIYMKMLGFTVTQFGWIFSANAVGLIAASQINRIWLNKHSSTEVLLIVTAAQFCVVMLLLTVPFDDISIKIGTIVLIFCYVFCFGFVNPNAMAVALQPFTRNVGSASALIGSLQMITGALASALVSYLYNGTAMPMIWVMSGCTSISLAVLLGDALFIKKIRVVKHR